MKKVVKIRINQYEICTDKIKSAGNGSFTWIGLPKDCVQAFTLIGQVGMVFRRKGIHWVIVDNNQIHMIAELYGAKVGLYEIRKYYPKEEILYTTRPEIYQNKQQEA